jgi:hypothetical protein
MKILPIPCSFFNAQKFDGLLFSIISDWKEREKKTALSEASAHLSNVHTIPFFWWCTAQENHIS